MIKYPDHIQNALQELTDKGFAVVIFTPNELQGVSPDYVENTIIEAGSDTIYYQKDPNIPDYDWENEKEEYPN